MSKYRKSRLYHIKFTLRAHSSKHVIVRDVSEFDFLLSIDKGRKALRKLLESNTFLEY